MKTLAILAVAVSVAVAFPGGARAGAILPTLTIDASSSVPGGDVLHLTPTLVSPGGGVFLAHVEATTSSYSLVMDLQLHADPSISGSFSLTNLSGSTQTFTVGASMSTAPFGGPTTYSGSYGDATFTDTSGNGDVTLSSAVFYQALIDAAIVAQRGSFTQNAFGGSGISGTISQEAFGPTGGGPGGSSIAIKFPGFSLTAGDKVETPFTFSVVPEPGTTSLLAGIGAIFLARALRSRSV